MKWFLNLLIYLFFFIKLNYSLNIKNNKIKLLNYFINENYNIIKYENIIKNNLNNKIILKKKNLNLNNLNKNKNKIIQSNKLNELICRLSLKKCNNYEKLISPCGCIGTQKVSFFVC